MAQTGNKIDMDALNEGIDRVLKYRPSSKQNNNPKPQQQRQPRPSASVRTQRTKRNRNR